MLQFRIHHFLQALSCKIQVGFFTRRKSLVCFHYLWFITFFSVQTVGRLCFPGHLSDRVMGGGGGGGAHFYIPLFEILSYL